MAIGESGARVGPGRAGPAAAEPVVELNRRRAVLVAALGFLQLSQQPPEVTPLRRWLDSWRGLGVVVEAMERRGWDVSITKYAEGCRATFIRSEITRRAPGSARCSASTERLGRPFSTPLGTVP